MRNAFSILLFEAALLGACAIGAPALDLPADDQSPSTPVVPDYAAHPGDSSLARGNVYIDSADLLTMESYPLQFSLSIKGSLATPCHKLRIQAEQPDSTGAIVVDAYSLVDPSAACTQVLEPFEANIPLGSFATGHYRVFLDGRQVAEFDT